jgi:hypothetical protein
MLTRDLLRDHPPAVLDLTDPRPAGILRPRGRVHRAKIHRLHRGRVLLHVRQQLAVLDDELVEQRFQIMDES